MQKEHKREIVQLWWAANLYFDLARKVISGNKLTKTDLRITVQELAEKCKSIPDIENNDTNLALMEINSHLGSCAVRLNTIDEILGKSYISSRWDFYRGMVDKKDELETYEITDNLNIIIHCLMRHNIAHREDPPENKAYKKMRDKFNQLKIEEIFENIRCVKKNIKADIKKHGVKI